MENKDLYIWSHYSKSLKYANQLVDSPELAKDLTSDALINIILICRGENPPDIEPDASAYINATIKNLALNLKKREILKVELNENILIENPRDSMEIEDFYKTLYKCSPSVIRITKTKLEGLSTKEGARKLNINESAYKTQWHRAKKELKEKLKKNFQL